MGLFSKKKTPSFDTGALRAILEQGQTRAKNEINTGFSQSAPLLKQFESSRNALGKAFETGANQRAQTFAQGLQQVESPEFVRQQQAKARELAFRDLPGTQELIREQLGATGGLNRGAAIRALQAPVLQAAQTASDQGFQIQQDAAARDINRRQVALKTIFDTGQGAALERLGIDEQTANTLLKTGRADIIDRAMALAGIEQNRTQGLLDIETLRQQQEIAKAQAKNARRGALLSSVGSLAGAGLGSFGGPTGALLGSNLGGQLGGLASGGTQPLDLSGILTALTLRRSNQPQQNVFSTQG